MPAPEPVKAEHVCYCSRRCTCKTSAEPFESVDSWSYAQAQGEREVWRRIQQANGDYRRRPFRRTERV